MRRLVPAVAVALAAVLAPQATAGSSVPPPTIKVTTTHAGGVEVVKSQAKVRWSVVQPGKQAELYVENTNLPGTTTTIETLWTSKPVRIYKGINAVAWEAEIQRRGVPSGQASAGYGVRFRIEGKSWSAWRDTTSPMPALIDRFPIGDQIKPVQDERVRYQFQVRFKVVIGDVNKEVHRWAVRANN